jgi:hypothetical protein
LGAGGLLRQFHSLAKKWASVLAPFFAEGMSLRRKMTDDSAYTLRAKKNPISVPITPAKQSRIEKIKGL